MDEQTPPVAPTAPEPAKEPTRQEIIRKYQDEHLPAKRAELVTKYPFLATIFSAVNHPGVVIVMLCLLLGVMAGWAGSVTLLGSLASVNGTTNTVGTAAGTFTLPGGYFLIQNGGISTTGALTANVQASFDNTNFTTVATYTPSATNATTDKFVPVFSPQTVYYRVQIVTTNAVNVGATFQQ